MAMELDIRFDGMVKRKVRRNKAGTYCFLYVPDEWADSEVAVLKLTGNEVQETDKDVSHDRDVDEILKGVGL